MLTTMRAHGAFMMRNYPETVVIIVDILGGGGLS